MKKGLSRLFKLPFEYYAVFFLFIVVILVSIYGSDQLAFVKRLASQNTYETFESAYTESTHSAASVSGKEVSVLEDTNGVLGLFEADGLKASPMIPRQIVDPVSQLSGSPNSVGISNGLSNSLGGLNLSPEVKKQFATRGGNQSGGNFQIG
jgi:hypothetical protein